MLFDLLEYCQFRGLSRSKKLVAKLSFVTSQYTEVLESIHIGPAAGKSHHRISIIMELKGSCMQRRTQGVCKGERTAALMGPKRRRKIDLQPKKHLEAVSGFGNIN